MLAALRSLRVKTMAYVEGLSEADLDGPVKVAAPEQLPGFDRVGSLLLIIALHGCLHDGEALVARRAGGGLPYFTPSEALRAF